MEMVHFIPPTQRRLVMLAAQADAAPVLISGSKGTGKGAIARWIHANSPRSARPFNEAKLDSPLKNQIAETMGGTLLVPEISEWPLGEQMTLLHYCQTKSIPHPSNPDMKMLANARIICTTSHDLDGRSQGGLFNPELLKKLSIFRVEMPELSRRQDEFEDIVTGILGETTRALHKEYIKALSPEVWERFRSYNWPGNLREIRNVLRIATISAQGDQIESSNLPEFGQNQTGYRATRAEFEKIYIQELLKACDWCVDKACQVSHMDRNTLLEKIKEYGITLTGSSMP